jgi:hypothetical protein
LADYLPHPSLLGACSLQLAAYTLQLFLAFLIKSAYFTRLIKPDFQHYN